MAPKIGDISFHGSGTTGHIKVIVRRSSTYKVDQGAEVIIWSVLKDNMQVAGHVKQWSQTNHGG